MSARSAWHARYLPAQAGCFHNTINRDGRTLITCLNRITVRPSLFFLSIVYMTTQWSVTKNTEQNNHDSHYFLRLNQEWIKPCVHDSDAVLRILQFLLDKGKGRVMFPKRGMTLTTTNFIKFAFLKGTIVLINFEFPMILARVSEFLLPVLTPAM